MGVMYELYGIPVYDDDIYHSGIKGMHWGIRRYQNPDGTLTPEGRKRYNVGSDGNLYDKETGKKYGLSTKAKIGIGAGAAALAGGAALAADQIFNGGRGRQAIGQFVGNTAQKVGNWAGNAADKVGDFAVGDRTSGNEFIARGGVAGSVGRAANTVGDWAQNTWGNAKEGIGNAANTVGDWAQNTWNGAKNIAGNVGDWAQNTWGNAKEGIGNLWNGQEVVGPTMDGAPARIGGAKQWLNDAADSVNTWWNGTGGDPGTTEGFYKTAKMYADSAAEEAAKAGGRQTSVDFFNSLADKARSDAFRTGGMSGAISNAANTVGDWAQNAWEGAKNVAGNVGDWAQNTATDFWKGQQTGRTTPRGSDIRTGGAKEFLNNAGDWIGDRAQDVGNWAKNTYNTAREGASNWFNSGAQQATQVAPAQPQAPSSVQRPIDISNNLLTVGQSAGNSGGFDLMSARNNMNADPRRGLGIDGLDVAVNGAVGALNGGFSAKNAYNRAKAQGYSDADARRIATGAGLGSGLTSTAAGIAGTVGDLALGNNFTWLGAGGQLAGAIGGRAAGNAIARKAVGPSSYMSELNNKIGQRVTLDNGQTGIFRGWSTLPNGQVIPILE